MEGRLREACSGKSIMNSDLVSGNEFLGVFGSCGMVNKGYI